jgi:hypothetical protein
MDRFDDRFTVTLQVGILKAGVGLVVSPVYADGYNADLLHL